MNGLTWVSARDQVDGKGGWNLNRGVLVLVLDKCTRRDRRRARVCGGEEEVGHWRPQLVQLSWLPSPLRRPRPVAHTRTQLLSTGTPVVQYSSTREPVPSFWVPTTQYPVFQYLGTPVQLGLSQESTILLCAQTVAHQYTWVPSTREPSNKYELPLAYIPLWCWCFPSTLRWVGFKSTSWETRL